MNGLTNILEVIGTNPMTIWVVALFALRALWSLLAWRRSGLAPVRGAATAGDGEISAGDLSAASRGAAPVRHTLRFAGVMILGIALAVVGLFRLAETGEGASLALLMLVVGMYLIATEPVRATIRFAEAAVADAALDDDEARALARAVLRDGHVKLMAIEFGLVGLFVLAMIVLRGPMAGLSG